MALGFTSWNAAPKQLALKHDEIHVWRARLAPSARTKQSLNLP
jgi:hypothetical protein